MSPKRRIDGAVMDEIKTLAIERPDWSQVQIHREVGGESVVSLRTVQRLVTEARSRGGAYEPWAMTDSAPEDWPLVFELMRWMDHQRGKATRPDRQVAEWYIRLGRSFPDLVGEHTILAVRLAGNLRLGHTRAVEDCLVYTPWRDRGKALIEAHRLGFVTAQAVHISGFDDTVRRRRTRVEGRLAKYVEETGTELDDEQRSMIIDSVAGSLETDGTES